MAELENERAGTWTRLGKNLNGYFGETIEIEPVLEDCQAAARARGWHVEQFCLKPGPGLLALVKGSLPASEPNASKRVYISAGIHGDEPAGPLAVRQLLREYDWPDALSVSICPCLNPAGFKLNRRENAQGYDLNRQYLNPQAEETLAHIAWLKKQPLFDLSLLLHEDWESHGFYVYELNPDDQPSLAPAILAAVEPVCPIDRSEVIEGRPAKNGLIRPSTDPRSRPDWPEAFFLMSNQTRLSYTLEAPSDYPLTARVAALVGAVERALDQLVERKNS